MKQENTNRPDWHQYFLGLAWVISLRSRDPRTKHGSVITDYNHIILGTGYNSFISGVDDSQLPLTAPEKYPYMMHAERNAVQNLSRCISKAEGAIIYITGKPCLDCLQTCLQSGVNEFHWLNRKIPTTSLYSESENDKRIHKWFLEQKKARSYIHQFESNWITKAVENIESSFYQELTIV
jgi:dCMP deaminase